MIELINFTKLSSSEKEMILEWRNDSSIRQWMFTQEPISLESHLSYIDSLPLRKDRIYFLVKQDNIAIGVIDFTNIDMLHKTAEIGLYAKPALKGVGTLLMQEIIHYAFQELKINRLISEVFEHNHAAIKLYKKFDFKEIEKRQEIIVMELKDENR